MCAHGVAIFQAGPRGDVPMVFVAGTDLAAIARAWSEACDRAGAADPDELRAAGCACRLVCIDPLGEEQLDRPRLIDDCLDLVQVRLVEDECTSDYGDRKVTETLAELKLATSRVEVPADADVSVLPEFEAVYTLRLDDGREPALGLLFVLTGRTDSTAVYHVREHEPSAMRGGSPGMAASARTRQRASSTRWRHG
jgi:hypothetical protein